MKPIDHDARQRAIAGLDASMAVSAGAGSGKTSVLAGRIVACLASGIDPKRIAAMTFTEKAAGELIVRVRDMLESQLASAQATNATALSTTLSTALANFGSLTISTIHSFCRDLLRHEAFTANFAPETTIGDDMHVNALATEAVLLWTKRLRNEDTALWRVLDAVTTTSSIVNAALHLERYRAYAPVASAEPFSPKAAQVELKKLAEAVTLAAKRCSKPDTCKLLEANQTVVNLVGAAVDDTSAGRHAVLDLLVSTEKPSTGQRSGRAADWDDGGREAYREALDAIVAWRRRWLSVAHGGIVIGLREVVIPALAAAKTHESLASFDDLLVEAARVLREQPAARARLSSLYEVVFIDEVQDTDPIQAEVALQLTRAIDHDGPAPGRLFAVGDPRQSIYRFRGADVTTFQDLEARIAARGERHVLQTNFRSVVGIVDWVNHVYGELPGYEAQTAQRGAGTIDPVVLIQGDEEQGDVEVDAVIAHVQSLFAANATIVDRETQALRPLRPADVMILLPAWGSADTIADAFRSAGLSCVVEGGGSFYERDEVRLLVAAARVIAEPADTEATALVLRGLFGVSVAAMAEHGSAGGALRCTIPFTHAGQVSDALGVLLKAHRQRGKRPLSGLLESLLSSTRAMAVWSLLPDGAARSANVDKLLSIVRTLEAECLSPLSVVDELNRQAFDRKGDKDIDRVDDDGDAIRITTLFKAKGLEAPLVVLMRAFRKNDSVDVVVDHQARSIAVRIKTLVPLTWAELLQIEDEATREERRRWMYVAATRARDQVVVCRTTPKQQSKSLLERDISANGLPTTAALPAHDETWHPKGAPPSVSVRVRHAAALQRASVSTATFPGHDDAIDALLAAPPGGGDVDGDAWAATDRERTRLAERGCVRWRAATSERGTPAAQHAPTHGSTSGMQSTLAVGARVGQVVHDVMERLDLSLTAEALSPTAKTLVSQLGARASLLPAEVAAADRVVDRILANPALAMARTAPERWHEVPFTFQAGTGAVVAGTIDLCFPLNAERTQWAVFDWKSSVPAVGSAKRAKYEAQLTQYAKALLRNFGDVDVAVREIVGPHPELGPVTTPDDAVLNTPERWRDAVAALVGAGAAAPSFDFDLEEDLPAIGDVVWVENHVALGVDVDDATRATLVERGWKLCADVNDAAIALGVPLAAEEGNDGVADEDPAIGPEAE